MFSAPAAGGGWCTVGAKFILGQERLEVVCVDRRICGGVDWWWDDDRRENWKREEQFK